MELSERYLQTLENEGFASVYEWQDAAGTVYQEHVNQGRVTFMVTDGSITFTLPEQVKELVAGQRFDVPVGVPHSMLVGPAGWIGIIGEELASDS